eukprot:3311321-Rhodomonas_salina.1
MPDVSASSPKRSSPLTWRSDAMRSPVTLPLSRVTSSRLPVVSSTPSALEGISSVLFRSTLDTCCSPHSAPPREATSTPHTSAPDSNKVTPNKKTKRTNTTPQLPPTQKDVRPTHHTPALLPHTAQKTNAHASSSPLLLAEHQPGPRTCVPAPLEAQRGGCAVGGPPDERRRKHAERRHVLQ